MSATSNEIHPAPSKWSLIIGVVGVVSQASWYLATHCFLGGDLPNICGSGALFATCIMVAFWGAFAVPWLWWWYRYGRHTKKSPDDEIKNPPRYNN